MNLPSAFSMLSKKQKPLKTLMVSAVRPSTPPCYSPEAWGLCCLKHKKTKKKPLSCFYQTFHVLHRGVQKTLLPHVPDSEQAGAAEAMVFFRLRKESFNCLFSPAIQTPAVMRLRTVATGGEVSAVGRPDTDHGNHLPKGKKKTPSVIDIDSIVITVVRLLT